MVIHGVQHMFHPPALLDAWPDDDRRSRLDRALFEDSLRAFNERTPRDSATPG